MRSALRFANELDADAAQDLLEDLEQGGIDELQRVAELIGIATDEDTLWHSIRVIEVKILLALKVQDTELAMDLANALISSGQLSGERLSLIRCLAQLLTISLDNQRDLAHYERPLIALYGEATYTKAQTMAHGEQLFTELALPGGSLDSFKAHQSMLAVYKRLQQAKTEHSIAS
jgi:ribosomal protein S12 methylthiotransferase accessory factor